MDASRRFHRIQQVLLIALALNWGVAGAKIFYGYWIDSSSMAADGFHSLSDGFSNIVGLLGIRIAERPGDQDHPYGHKKFETLTSVAISGFLALTALNVVREGVSRFFHPVTPRVDGGSFVVMVVTLAINLGVMLYETRQGRALKSDILLSDSLHTRSDILTSLSVLITLAGVRLGFPILDPLASLVIAGFIGKAAFEIWRESSRVLSDAVAIPIEEIQALVLSIPGVKECHRIRSRGRPDDIHIDLHVLVDPEMHLHQAHDLSESIEKEIKGRFPGAADVVVHMEPVDDVPSRG